MDQSNPTDTPIEVGSKLMKGREDEECCDRELYQSVVGCLLYLSTRTRPDIAFAVGSVARHSAKPSKNHWTAVKRILRYLKGTSNFGLLYGHGQKTDLVGYCDADWAGDVDTRHSTSGYIFQIGGGAVSWRSKKQTCVALSTAESEYIALASALQEAVWMRLLMSNLNGEEVNSLEPTVVFEDNTSAISISKNQQFHGRTKHIDIKYHYVREQVAAKTILLEYCKSEDMLADIFK